ncbi:hypothetical protein F4820DRAFT_202233 [Hypoxylon rubiginosum]|uniref:Uncharacterized protein n=1 Tax=Hypoxylon rubiginosum TaxID=110542 RepID=A0ACB9Z7W3_9PEZI|nr:hypothetical protein F4820DRAFT_202233 [Hypoxylon rubiginosum]
MSQKLASTRRSSHSSSRRSSRHQSTNTSRQKHTSTTSGKRSRPADGATTRDDRLWPRDKRYLAVRFLDGSSDERQLVESLVVNHYHAIAMRIRFRFLKFSDATSPSDIRITFTTSGCSSSYLGRDNEKIAKNSHTMKLNMNQTSRSKVQADVLHEFGHALGLIHEPKHPGCKLNFNRTALKNRYGYDDKFINKNYGVGSVIGARTTRYDIYSIMHYPVEQGDTVSLVTRIPLNTVLSDGDKQLLMSLYPDDPEPKPKPKPRVSVPVTVVRPKTTSTTSATTTLIETPRPKTKKQSQPVYLSGSGNSVVEGGYIVISGSGNVVINGDSEVVMSGSGNVILNGNGTVRKSGCGCLIVNGDCVLEASGSGTVRVRGSGTAKVFGSGSVRFLGKCSGTVSGSGTLK